MPQTTAPKDLIWLKERSPLPLLAVESYHTAGDIAHCAECFHGVNVKLVKTGGVSAGFAALSSARKAGLKTMIGCMIETSVLISAAAHLAMQIVVPDENRQVRILPSEVMRMRLQWPQKGCDTGAMIPISPMPSSKQ